MAKRVLVLLGFVAWSWNAAVASPVPPSNKFDQEIARRAGEAPGSQTTSVIVTLQPGGQLPSEFQRYTRRSPLGLVNGVVLDVPNSLLGSIAGVSDVARVSHNRPVVAHNFRTSLTSGAFFVRRLMGLTGEGVGVAIIDSGIVTYHDDFTTAPGSTQLYPYGNQRVSFFKDFVNGRTLPYDDYGHGTHVSGIVAGNGFDSRGELSGMAPGASLVSLKVLDANGQGVVSDVIAALEWVAGNASAYNIRVVNLSIGAEVLESFETDPLTLAAKALVDRGVVVVAAAGNDGQDANGNKLWGGIAAPGNAPWVLTVGASSTQGTFTRSDDVLASFSSRGPTPIDFTAKPDLAASGVGTVSTASPGSTFYADYPQYRVAGEIDTAVSPYFVLSGTSQAAPVVSGTVALMLQANPNLTPNLVKAILEFTAQPYDGYQALEQGAGFLNSLGAVRLAQFFADAQPGDPVPVEPIWSGHIIWGNYEVSGGLILPGANAWNLGVEWGSARTQGSEGDDITWGAIARDNIVGGTSGRNNIVWGTSGRNNIVWGTSGRNNIVWGTSGRNNIVWGTNGRNNIVWGTECGGADCPAGIVWGAAGRNNIVWGTGSPDGSIAWDASGRSNIVWGTSGRSNIVWGTIVRDNIVWGTSGRSNIVWGTAGLQNIVWGTADVNAVVWGTVGRENIVWGTFDRNNIVWGTLDRSNIVWGTAGRNNIVWGTAGLNGIDWSTAGLSGPEPEGGWYWWFLDPYHDFLWISHEFGDAVGVAGGTN